MITDRKYQINELHCDFRHSRVNRCQRYFHNNFFCFNFDSFCLIFAIFGAKQLQQQRQQRRIQFHFFCEKKKYNETKKVKMLILLFQGIIYSMNSWTKMAIVYSTATEIMRNLYE